MRKFLLLLLLILSFFSCSSLKEKNISNPIINNTGSVIGENVVEIPFINSTGSIIGENVVEIPDNYELPKDDLKSLLKMIDNDKEYFAINNDELDLFHIRRDYLFGENYTNGNLISCLNKSIYYSELDGFDAEICKGKNEFIVNEDLTGGYNAFHIKDTLIKLKKVKDGEKFDCEYFINTSYDFDIEEKVLTKIDDYFICKKLQDDNFPLLKEYYNFFRIIGLSIKGNKNFCEALNDKNLIKLCNEKI